MTTSGAAQRPLLLLFLLLSAAFVLAQDNAEQGAQVQAQPTRPTVSACCSAFTSKAIPCRLLKSYFYSARRCPLTAIVFVTQRNRQICANPGDAWVQQCQSMISQHN